VLTVFLFVLHPQTHLNAFAVNHACTLKISGGTFAFSETVPLGFGPGGLVFVAGGGDDARVSLGPAAVD
jgi:hypothetical protein